LAKKWKDFWKLKPDVSDIKYEMPKNEEKIVYRFYDLIQSNLSVYIQQSLGRICSLFWNILLVAQENQTGHM
jgi:hypothetical protein